MQASELIPASKIVAQMVDDLAVVCEDCDASLRFADRSSHSCRRVARCRPHCAAPVAAALSDAGSLVSIASSSASSMVESPEAGAHCAAAKTGTGAAAAAPVPAPLEIRTEPSRQPGVIFEVYQVRWGKHRGVMSCENLSQTIVAAGQV